MPSPERAAAERIYNNFVASPEDADPKARINEIAEMVREAYAGVAPPDMDAEWEEFCQTLGQEVMDDEQVAKLFAQRMLAKRGASPDAELVRVLRQAGGKLYAALLIMRSCADLQEAPTEKECAIMGDAMREWAEAERILKEHK